MSITDHNLLEHLRRAQVLEALCEDSDEFRQVEVLVQLFSMPNLLPIGEFAHVVSTRTLVLRYSHADAQHFDLVAKAGNAREVQQYKDAALEETVFVLLEVTAVSDAGIEHGLLVQILPVCQLMPIRA